MRNAPKRPPGSVNSRSRPGAPTSKMDLMATHGEPARFVKAVFDTPLEMADEAAGLLVARGAIGCAVGRPLRRSAKPARVVPLEAFFDDVTASELAGLSRALKSAGMLSGDARKPRAECIADPGWSVLWMKRFVPLRIGRRFLIVPPWSEVRDATRFTIKIKPAQAFGTGHHPSTAGMLRALERLAPRGFGRALDVGTGSGILAIAMTVLGATDVLGIDVDPEAVRNARDNAALNHLDRRPRFSSAPIAAIRRRFDLVVANILASTLIEIGPHLARLLATDGRLILGGIHAREAKDVLRAYRPELRPLETRSDRGWTTLVIGR
jgi:ribosomal protein L11 methyltransferase